MRPDKFAERLSKSAKDLTPKQATIKLSELINLYHSIDARYGSDEEKKEAKVLIRKEVMKLRSRVGKALASNCQWYLIDKEAWNATRESLYQ